MKINISGSASALASMGAVVQTAGIDLATGELSLSYGTCRGLEADSLVALYRATRGRRYAWSVHSQISSGDDASSVDGGHFNNANTSPSLSKAAERIAAADAGNRTHIIDLKPGSISFASNGDASAQTIQPREVLIPVVVNGVPKIKKVQAICGADYGSSNTIDFRTVRVIVDDNGTLKAQQASVLCTEPSGEMSEVGGGGGAGNPAAPEYYSTLGSATEGTDTADATTWTAGSTDANDHPLGLKVWMVSRVVYTASGDAILYYMARCLTFTSAGQLYSVSGETRVEVDTPVTHS